MHTDTVIAANRFGLGAKPGDLTRIDGRHERWLKDQLAGPSRPSPVLADLPTTPKILADFNQLRNVRKSIRDKDDDAPSPDIVREYTRIVRTHYVAQVTARYAHAAVTDLPFHERLVHFWGNHFAVQANKQPLSALAGAFENEAIRPNLGGRFIDLLLAVERHPAMIMNLDNQRSIGPNSSLAKRANSRRNNRELGLNENLAREILELHTLGVDGGYTQDDVTAFARVLTGWSIGGGDRPALREGRPGEFEFRENIHEPGTQTVLGQRYAQKDEAQGVAVLHDLAMHPSTARHIAGKLALHFVADEPPAALVARLADTYLESGGDLPTLHAALSNAPEAYASVHAKYKSPHDYVISAYRAFDYQPDDGRRLIGSLDLMGQTPYRPGSPAGWPDTADEWGGADALLKRIEWANAVAAFSGDRIEPVALGEAALGVGMSANTRAAVARAESTSQGLALLLASPDFQRR